MPEFLEDYRAQIDRSLEQIMPPEGTHPSRLVAAMRYSLFAGGKRIRPILVLCSASCVGAGSDSAMFAACAVELVHTYSLVHDDLPAMDDDDFRRGKPTCHRAYDEGTAILAGDALLTMAFEVLSDPEMGKPVDSEMRMRMISTLGQAVGWKGMVGGQQVDMDSEGQAPTQPTVEYIHTHKTGALIRCSVLLGAMAGGAEDGELRALRRYGENLGLAFQIVDDILDLTATTEEMGKDQGSDKARNKITYPAVFGLEESRRRAMDLIEEAKASLAPLNNPGHLLDIADFVLLRRL
jgi:geranylgeranyl diphosphate synthase type II